MSHNRELFLTAPLHTPRYWHIMRPSSWHLTGFAENWHTVTVTLVIPAPGKVHINLFFLSLRLNNFRIRSLYGMNRHADGRGRPVMQPINRATQQFLDQNQNYRLLPNLINCFKAPTFNNFKGIHSQCVSIKFISNSLAHYERETTHTINKNLQNQM